MADLSFFCRDLRKKQKWNLKEAAVHLHTDHRRLSRFEKGFDTLSLGEVERLAALGKRDLVELLCLDSDTRVIRIPSRLHKKLLNVLLSELLQNENLPDVVRAQLPAIFKKLMNKIH